MYDINSARRIKDHFPNIKILVVVRDPIDRTISDYYHSIRKGLIPANMTFDDYIQDEKRLEYGLYAKYLKHYFRIFESTSIHIIEMKEFNDNPKDSISKVYEFLNVSSKFIPKNLDKKVNQGDLKRLLFIEKMMTKTSKYFNDLGYIRLIEAIKRTGFPNLIRRLNRSKKTKQEIPAKSRKFLEEFYRDDILELNELTGKEFFKK
jgi:hypothetical protein